MEKYIIAIEETVVENFEVLANSEKEALEIAREKYYSHEFILEPGECQYTQIAVVEPNDNGSVEWEVI